MSDRPSDVERKRLDADRRYNDALTALDRSIVAAAEREPLTRGDLSELATALMVFLQQITAFVDTKDRELHARLTERLDLFAPTQAAVAELGTKIGVLQRIVDALGRAMSPGDVPPPGPEDRAKALATPDAADEAVYVGFEDEFRGSEARIAERLRDYVPLFAGARDVVDLGCGRGEFLTSLAAAGIGARGVDANSEMAAIARSRGADAAHGDALAFLGAMADESVGGLMAAQVVEHLEPPYLVRLLSTARRKLRPGAPIVIETINPACWLAFFSSYIRDPTHVRPVHPDTLQYLLQANGFDRVSIRYSAPVPDHMKMKPVAVAAEILASPESAARALVDAAHVVNANAAILNNLLFTYLDYAAVGYRG